MVARLLDAPRDAAAPVRHEALERSLLVELYRPPAAPAWSHERSPTAQARGVLAALSSAETHGLRSADYGVSALKAWADSLRAGDSAALAGFDVSLSRAVIRFSADLHRGRVDPLALRFEIRHEPDEWRLLEIVRRATRASDAAEVLATAAPRYAGYAALVEALARYRTLAADTTLRLPPVRGTLRRGDPYKDAAAMARLLVALGDLRAGDAPAVPDSAFDGPLPAAIAAFQRRHGLEPDSVVGAATLAQLRVPLAQRVAQVELAMERWRWLPDTLASRYVIVNIPAFSAAVHEDDSLADHPELRMKVIVGQARGHQTPMFSAVMQEAVFRPWWEVPPSIARKELVPLIRRRPGYMEREHLEIARDGSEGAPALPATKENLARVAAGSLRLRQRPGPGNSLGLVKFVFPNSHHVYLHDTPTRNLFAFARRDLSHGCMRAEQPAALATFVLRGQAGWDSSAVATAMNGSRTRHVPIARAVTVYVTYTTAVAEGGTVYFFGDVYGRDAALSSMLKRDAPPARVVRDESPTRLQENLPNAPAAP